MRAVESVRNKTFRCPECGKKLRLAPRGEPDTPDPMEGKRFAHYEIKEKVGEGAMASVYRATNLRLDKTVALKILSERATMGPVDTARRFLAEARSAASLDHSNVLSVYYVGESEGKHFIEMQYADGGTVREALSAKGRFDVREAAQVIRDAARGLQAAHTKKIIHRDVKPQNLMLTTEGEVKVADFGLAKLQDTEKELTAAGFVVGTPLYMSPEQVAGKTADHRADIYALGITFFEMLTGHPPFDAATPVAILHMHAFEKIPSPRKHVPNLPESICRIIGKMTRKKPEQRYADCRELIEDLDHFLAGSTEISALEPEEETDTGMRIEVDDINIFQTMARYAFVSGQDPDVVANDLRQKAKELEIPPDKAEQIIAGGLARRRAADKPVQQSIEDVTAKFDKKRLQERRREEAARLFRLVTHLAFVLAAVVVLIVGVCAARSLLEKRRAAAHAQREKEKEQQRLAEAERAAQEGEKLEAKARWQGAVAKYRESLELSDNGFVKRRLAIALKTLSALDLEKQGKWDEAQLLLEEILKDTPAHEAISRRIEWLKGMKHHRAVYEEAKRAYEEKRWKDAAPKLREAAELARKLGLTSDAARLAQNADGKLDEEQERQKQMEWLLDTCRSKRAPYALFAAADYYLASPAHVAHREMLQKAKEEAQLTINGTEDTNPNAPLEETKGLHAIKLRKGEMLYGVLIEKTDHAVEIQPIEGATDIKRLIHIRDIESLDPITTQDINNMRAERVLRGLVDRWKAGQPFDCLQAIGRLMTRFPNAKILSSSAGQKAKFGETLDGLLTKAVGQCEPMCPVCEGTGSVPCDQCNGQGKQSVTCKRCKNPLRLPRCPTCRGGGVRLTGRCENCNGTGRLRCKHCKGKGCVFCGSKGTWDCKVCEGTGRVPTKTKCSACRGTGYLAGKVCPKCYGRGRLPCTDCKGTGRVTCPDCGGKGIVYVPCAKCNQTGRLPCRACQGTGKR